MAALLAYEPRRTEGVRWRSSPGPHPNLEIHGEPVMKTLPIMAAAALLMTSGPALAQSASDAQCLILSNAFATQAKDDNAKKLAESAFYFYLGRIAPNATSAQLKSLLDTQMKSLSDTTAGGQMNTCANAVRDKVQLVGSIAAASKPAAPAQKQSQPQGR
jgi:hypothetical protein